jgi:bifunctional non-homologous end joining protein LigD
MALDEYKRKRDFNKTPEPGPELGPKREQRFFCVQKHLASHLHYDFRLEHNGVLLSWAIPKGPSLDPKTKRLAMMVEDHPVAYGQFEGVIPEGYGAGIVMLWDVGTWTPETDDVDAALKKGELKFTLDGYKLKGSWVLVRTGGRYAGARGGGNRSWLLIKHRDDWAGDVDITEFAPKSVKSEGELEDILAADTPAIWESHRPAKGGDAGAMFAKIIERAAKLKASPARSNKISTADTEAGTTPKTGRTKAADTERTKAAPTPTDSRRKAATGSRASTRTSATATTGKNTRAKPAVGASKQTTKKPPSK